MGRKNNLLHQIFFYVQLIKVRSEDKVMNMYINIERVTTNYFFLLKTIVYLINNRRMFNLEIDNLAEKPYIPQKKYFYEFVANVLRDNIGILIFDLHGGC